MLLKVKPELIKTELAAISLCAVLGVLFLSVTAFTRERFAFAEWWGFTAGGFAWINLILLRFFNLHEKSFHLALQHKTLEEYRRHIETLQAAAIATDEMVRNRVEMVSRLNLGEAPVAKNHPVTDEPETYKEAREAERLKVIVE